MPRTSRLWTILITFQNETNFLILIIFVHRHFGIHRPKAISHLQRPRKAHQYSIKTAMAFSCPQTSYPILLVPSEITQGFFATRILFNRAILTEAKLLKWGSSFLHEPTASRILPMVQRQTSSHVSTDPHHNRSMRSTSGNPLGSLRLLASFDLVNEESANR